MQSVPNSMGELRKLLVQTMHDMRYGHVDVQTGLGMAKVGAQVANLINAEIDACKFLMEVGDKTQKFGGLPIDKIEEPAQKTLNHRK